jgi:hypothetical protein
MAGPYEHLLDELDAQEVQEGFSSVDLLNFPPAYRLIYGETYAQKWMTFTEISDELQHHQK